ncbi:type I-F CRISPR-associated helicase Cas3 [Mixta calida]|nr:type I-F CRISPR-associated helicase Cas3 [Mixta calida]
MNILLISQCNKRALVETRRILDQFAERKGDRTWQTAITLEGLATLRALLRKSARRNTAVACHWIKSANQTELLWIVGNLRRFNASGSVPTNTTSGDILRQADENSWHSGTVICLLAAIAALFHDFGKANQLFQRGLRGEVKGSQPWRHEWVSLRLFCAFVNGRQDREWLTALSQIQAQDEADLLTRLYRDDTAKYVNPFFSLPPIARTIAWLILSHHRLPVGPAENPVTLDYIDRWLTEQLTTLWNSRNEKRDFQPEERVQVWQFSDGTPLRSAIWRQKAHKFATRALRHAPLEQYGELDQRFTAHLARLTLMLADHHYSAQPPVEGWQDKSYMPHANTDRKTGRLKQRLDEHNVGVAQNAWLLGLHLPHIRKTLPAIVKHRGFKQRSKQARFRWQDSAYDTTKALAPRAARQGFFGVNMASTGCGKTFANARIMYALADEKQGCRFTVALGLRTLTLQTGTALREKLKLDKGDLAVLTGSAAVQQLYKLEQEKKQSANESSYGSASEEELYAGHHYISYEGSLNDGRLSQWLAKDEKANRLISAPVLVTTIDHIIPATEGVRGGKQIAPMLRLLTSDLVLDEPDDFDVSDLHALCRLVNWAGMLGSRVLLSSATLTPAQVQALFASYRTGRAYYQQACGNPDTPAAICCAWFDEKMCVQAQDIADGKAFSAAHEAFINKRVAHLQTVEGQRRGELVPVTPADRSIDAVVTAMAQRLHTSLLQLHAEHHQTQHVSGRTLSIGLIRMANINPLVAVAQQLFTLGAPENTYIHYCVYHSHHPLAGRSYIEACLDRALARHDEDAIWQVPEIAAALQRHTEQNHIFVVLATAVAEVGRDHDYDWAIVEPSSMRSIIQLAGRVLRHRRRDVPPATANIHLLSKNYRALRGKELAYCRPGFENKDFRLHSHDLHDLLTEEQYQQIGAIPRIQQPHLNKGEAFSNLVELEHARMRRELGGGLKNQPVQFCSALWWRNEATWSGELQRRSPFRQSQPDISYFLWLEDEDEQPVFMLPDEGEAGWKAQSFKEANCLFAEGCGPWLEMNYAEIYQRLAEEMDMALSEVSQAFGEITLLSNANEGWYFHSFLGMFGAPG